MIGDLDEAKLRERLAGGWGASLIVMESTASTMNDALAAASEGAPDGHVVVADRQTEGRGAHGRAWASPPGSDLYLSIVARPAVEPSSMALVTLATGLGVRDAVAELTGERPVQVKWPNDIWIGDKKCAGILVESRMMGSQIEAIIIGIGLNVNRMEWPPELETVATSIRAERSNDATLDRSSVLATLLGRVEQRVTRLTRDGGAALIDALRPHLALVGQPVTWEDGQGVFEGIEATGAALVRTEQGVEVLRAARLQRVPTDG